MKADEELLFQVQESEAGQRLDLFLSSKLPGVSRSSVQRWIRMKRVQVMGKLPKSGYLVKAGEQVLARPLPPAPSSLLPQDLPLQILHEDKALIVIDKPAGMVVHPGAGNRQGTLANALLHHLRRRPEEGELRPGIVHRLDKETSGLLVVAKKTSVHEQLAGQFKRRQVGKMYLALAYGVIREQEGIIDVPLGRHPRQRTRMAPRSEGRPARTRFRVLKRYSHFTLLQVYPETGRTHQIRVHLRYLGHPVVGDRTYGADRLGGLPPPLSRQVRELGRHFLHAAELSFQHPETKREVSFSSPLPPELERFLHSLE